MASKKIKAMPEAAPYVDPYRAEDDARTLARAAEITGDKGRHGAAKAHAEKTFNATMSLGKPGKTKPAKKPAVKKPTIKKVK